MYRPCLRGTFLWDDDAYISQNAALTTVQGLRDIWFKPGAVQQYYPLTFTVFWMEYQLWGLNPLGYHLVNVLLHGFNALLFWMILESLGISGAWIAAWLFALHPAIAESVAWMTQLKSVLMTFFYLLTVLFLVTSAKLKPSAARKPWLIALFFFICALLSKTVTMTLPFAYLLIHRWVKGSWNRKTMIDMLPFVGVGLGAGLFTIYFEHGLVGAQGAAYNFTPLQRFIMAGHAFWFYLGKLIHPSPLSFIYPRWPTQPGLLSIGYPLAALALLGLCAWGQKRWGKLPLACLVFFSVSLLPVVGVSSYYFMRYSFVADHFQYIASLGIFTLAGWGLTRLLDLLQVPLPSPFGIAIVSMLGINLALGTQRQARKYADPIAFWEDTLSANPGAAIAHHNLGIVFTQQGRLNDAVAHLRTAEALDPTFPQTHLALAYLALHANRPQDARHQYEEAIRLGVTDPVVLKDYAALQK